MHFSNEVKSPNPLFVKLLCPASLAKGLSIRIPLFGYMELDLEHLYPTLLSEECTCTAAWHTHPKHTIASIKEFAKFYEITFLFDKYEKKV
jgi:hypothetical protein